MWALRRRGSLRRLWFGLGFRLGLGLLCRGRSGMRLRTGGGMRLRNGPRGWTGRVHIDAMGRDRTAAPWGLGRRGSGGSPEQRYHSGRRKDAIENGHELPPGFVGVVAVGHIGELPWFAALDRSFGENLEIVGTPKPEGLPRRPYRIRWILLISGNGRPIRIANRGGNVGPRRRCRLRRQTSPKKRCGQSLATSGATSANSEAGRPYHR